MRSLPSPRAAWWRARVWLAARGWHSHVMEPIAVQDAKQPGLPFALPATEVLRRCRFCPELDTIHLTGAWSIEQLTGVLVVLDVKASGWPSEWPAATGGPGAPRDDPRFGGGGGQP